MSRIPNTDSIQELADFWDTHDLTDFAEELEEVAETVFERDVVVEVHLSEDEAAALAQIAQRYGVDHSALIRNWVLERLHAA